jgi:hypothetical protein
MELIFFGRQGLPGEKSMDEMLSSTLNGLMVAALILAAAADMGLAYQPRQRMMASLHLQLDHPPPPLATTGTDATSTAQ